MTIERITGSNLLLRVLCVLGVLTFFLNSAFATTTVENYWDFENGYGDLVGAADGTAGATVTTGTGHDAGTAMNTQATISGADDFVDISPASLYSPGTAPFSMSYWYRVADDNTTSPRGIFDFGGNGGDGAQSLYIGNTGNLAFRLDGTSGGAAVLVPMAEDDAWHFVAATYEPGVALNVHIDGVGIDGTLAGADFGDIVNNSGAGTAGAYLGAFNFTGASQDKGLNGSLDDVAVYSGLLSDAQISGLFDGSLSPLQVPEPCGISMLVLGLLGSLAFVRSRR